MSQKSGDYHLSTKYIETFPYLQNVKHLRQYSRLILQIMELIKRITIDPEIYHGKPCIRNLRYLVASILEYLAAGDSAEEILTEFTDLQEEDIQACLLQF